MTNKMIFLSKLSSSLKKCLFFVRFYSTDHFPVLNGSIDTVSKSYADIYQRNSSLCDTLQNQKFKARSGGGDRAIKRHTEINKKYLVRQRLNLLLDSENDFLEIAPLAGCLGLDYGEVPSAGVVIGIGLIRGRRCMILANDATVKGGTIYPITVKKQLRGQEIAQMLRLPCVYIVDSGGAYLPLQADIFPDKEHGGRVFYNEAVMGSIGIPQIAVVCGSCTAGAAYIPTMADHAIIVNQIGSVFLGGPPLVKAALGEDVSSEELGGATMHCSTSGCTDYFAADEPSAFSICRDIVESLDDQPVTSKSTVYFDEPMFSPMELIGIDHTKSEFVYQLLSRILDGSRFREFRQLYGSTLITGFGRIGGHLVGILASTGLSIDDRSALKACQFIQICNSGRLPIIFFPNSKHNGWHNSDGDGINSARILKSTAALISAISTSQSWKITVNVRDCYGQDYFALCGRSFNPVFSFIWPNASLGFNRSSNDVKDDECAALYAASRLWVDDVILPQDTRRILIQCLNCLPSLIDKTGSCSIIRM